MPWRHTRPLSAACLVLACTPSAGIPSSAPVAAQQSPSGPKAVVDAGIDGEARLPRAEANVSFTGPVIFLEASATGAWVAVCQPTLQPGADASAVGSWQRSVALASGKVLSVTDLVAADANGRFLVVERAKRFELIDAALSTATPLLADIDARRFLTNYSGHRSVAFDGVGRRLAYLARNTSGQSRIVIRDLATGLERTGPRLQTEPSHLSFVGEAPESLVLYGVARDTNGDGRRSLPALLFKEARECDERGGFTASGSHVGDELVPYLVNVDSGQVRPAPGWVAQQGPAEIIRDEHQRLLRKIGDEQAQLADQDCGARLLAGNAAQQRLLVACYKKPGRSPLRLVGPGQSVELGVDLALSGEDHLEHLDTRLFAVHPGREAALVDLERGRVHALGEGRLVLSVSGRFALVRHGSKLLGISLGAAAAAPASEKVVLDGLADVSDVVQGKKHIVIDRWVVERASGLVLGRVPERALAVDTRGRVLSGTGADLSELRGPLRYVEPSR